MSELQDKVEDLNQPLGKKQYMFSTQFAIKNSLKSVKEDVDLSLKT